nr:immunoglobulin heavy chain junction region [Macaca mulatta]MOY23180.1 immunoglobulin heavy chain junction region [Macaca mulatta]MOY23373.1 immunoglobulin heavy chain junction region [Macaca mulatta]MOY23694.1 immunoglobulin heavy chain junction region [Macaca mulatta]MOY24871.1 immunoglobulin heavy chain junction region [Macaca mulatta]
CVRVNSNYDYW